MKFIFHIGAGKTGSTSIQKTLQKNIGRLRDRGIYYLGMMLNQNVAKVEYDWQKKPTVFNMEAFHKLDDVTASEQILDILVPTIAKAKKENIETLIWSNESFFGRKYNFLKALETLRDEHGIDVEILIYVREYSSWAQSSYIQWGIKHKNYPGEVKPFGVWKESRNFLFFKPIHRLKSKTDLKVCVRNMSAHEDVVVDFLEHAGISPSGLKVLKDNMSPSNEELLMRIVYNSMFDREVPIREFDEEVGRLIKHDKSPSDYLAIYVPKDEDLFELCQKTSNDKNKLNKLLEICSENTIKEFSNRKNFDVNDSKMISMLMQIIFGLKKEIQDIKNELNDLREVSGQ